MPKNCTIVEVVILRTFVGSKGILSLLCHFIRWKLLRRIVRSHPMAISQKIDEKNNSCNKGLIRNDTDLER